MTEYARVYELRKELQLYFLNPEPSFVVRIYTHVNGRKLGELEDTSPKGLAKKALQKFTLEESRGDEVRSISEKMIKEGVAKLPVSDDELIEFYKEFNHLSAKDLKEFHTEMKKVLFR